MLMKNFVFPVFLSLFSLSPAYACDLPQAKPVWIASDADSTVIMVGSVHRLAPGEFSTPAAAQRLTRASTVYFESKPLSMFGTLRAAVRGRSSASLETLLPAEDWSRVDAIGERLGVGQTILRRLDPFLLAGYLQERNLQDGSTRTSKHGVDAMMRRYASARRADIQFLEDKQALLAAIDALPMAAKLDFLMTAVGEIERNETSAATELWLTGDLCKLDEAALEMSRSARANANDQAIYQLLVVERNAAFTEVAHQALGRPGVHMMVVGALHFVGPDNVLSQLRAKGVAVTLAPPDE